MLLAGIGWGGYSLLVGARPMPWVPLPVTQSTPPRSLIVEADSSALSTQRPAGRPPNLSAGKPVWTQSGLLLALASGALASGLAMRSGTARCRAWGAAGPRSQLLVPVLAASLAVPLLAESVSLAPDREQGPGGCGVGVRLDGR